MVSIISRNAKMYVEKQKKNHDDQMNNPFRSQNSLESNLNYSRMKSANMSYRSSLQLPHRQSTTSFNSAYSRLSSNMYGTAMKKQTSIISHNSSMRSNGTRIQKIIDIESLVASD